MPPNIPAAVAWYLLRHSARGLYRRTPAWLSYKQFVPRKRVVAAAAGLSAMPFFAQTRRGRKREAAHAFMGQHSAPVNPDLGTMANRAYKRRKVDSVVKGSNVQTFRKMRSGKKHSTSSRVMSLMKSATQSQVHRFQNLTVANDPDGAYPLSYYNDAAADPLSGSTNLPIYFMDLNNLAQNAVSGTNYFDVPFKRLRRIDGTALNKDHFCTVALNGIQNEGSLGGVNYNWSFEKNINAYGPAVGGISSAYLDWVEIRLLLYGARKFPSSVRVSLIRWNDTEVQPRLNYSATYPATALGQVSVWRQSPDVTAQYAITSETEDQKRWNGYWLQHTAPMVSNPLILRDHNVKRPFDVIRTQTYSFQPRDTSVDGPTGGVGEQVVLKWFHNVGKTYRYIRPSTNQQPDADEQVDPNEWNQTITTAELDWAVAPKARLSLMIEGISQSAASVDREADTAPSFDMCVRRKITFAAN